MASSEVDIRRFNMGRHYDPRRTAVCEWLRANGLDPNRVPVGTWAVIDRGQLTVDVFEEDHRSTTTQTVPLLQEPSLLVLGEI